MSVAGRLQVYTADECIRLLAGVGTARLALTARALPFVAPIRFHLDGDALVIPIDHCPPLANAARSTPTPPAERPGTIS